MAHFSRIRLVLREPLLHFLLLGLGLFLLHGWLVSAGGGTAERIVITQGRIEQLTTGFALMKQRPPAADELKGLIDDAIREEIFYREAKAMGLDQDDTIVRRRLRQKLEFVSQDVTPVPEPGVAQLQAYLQAHPDQFRLEARYTFAQVYLDPQRRKQQLEADTAQMLSTLQHAGSSVDAGTLGDTLLIGHHFDGIAASEVVRLFGAKFEHALRALPTGQWLGPVPSGYGVHLVRINRREDSRVASLDDVRGEVRRRWLHDQREEANERFYADLRKRYQVTIEMPSKPKEDTAVLVAGMQQ